MAVSSGKTLRLVFLLVWLLCPLFVIGFASNAFAACAVFGDSIAVGLGQALNGACPTSAEVGIVSSVVASRVTPGDRWAIVSLGSNDFPKGISSQLRVLSEARVRRALDNINLKTGKRLILILPANEARATVQDWATKDGVPTVSFEAGQDGIHPRRAAYDAMARDIENRIKG